VVGAGVPVADSAIQWKCSFSPRSVALTIQCPSTQVFMPQIRQQALTALAEAQVVLLVVDGMAGCTPLDEDIAAFMRKQKVRRSFSILGLALCVR
jgi:hypothetical protein